MSLPSHFRRSQSSANAANAASTSSSSSSHHQPGDASGSIGAVQATLDRLTGQRDELGELWSTRKARLDLLLRLRLFERDALELSSQYKLWAKQLQGADIPRSGDPREAEAQLRNLGEHVNHIQTATLEVAQRGQELLQVLE